MSDAAEAAARVSGTAAPEADRSAPGRPGPPERERPPVPATLEEAGLDEPFVLDLILRTLYRHGATAGDRLEQLLRLPYPVVDDPLLTLQQRRLIDVRATTGRGRRGYTFDLSGEGRDRTRELMAVSGYVGPAPVSLEKYREWMERQSVRSAHITSERIHDGTRHLVLEEAFLEDLGPAVNSGRSIFLYGNSGNGKTVIAEAVAELIGGSIFIPWAIRADGQVIQVYDPAIHVPVQGPSDHPPAPGGAQATAEEGESFVRAAPTHDPRFVEVRRPAVIVGGELTLAQLELQHDPVTDVFRAPPQVKANGGVLVIDDFGRQKVRPRDLLNRWMYPLEKHVDFLDLPTGQKLGVPFECLLIFATNLDPSDLVEEAFLRRIRYKILVEDPTRSEYEEILRRACGAADVAYREAASELVFSEFYGPLGIAPRKCHPRDLVHLVADRAGYTDDEPALTAEAVRWACRSYFLGPEVGREHGGAENRGGAHGG